MQPLPPATENKIHFYRLTNISYGIFESCEFMRKELMKMLVLQVRGQQKSFGQRIVGVALTVVAAVPVLYELIPDDSRWRPAWLWTVGVLGALYLGVTVYQWNQARRDERELDELLPAGADRLHGLLAEDSPEFLSRQLSAYRTRWQMAQAIVADKPPPATLRMFAEIQRYWEAQLRDMENTLLRLKHSGRLDEGTYSTLAGWIPEWEPPATAATGTDDGDGRDS